MVTMRVPESPIGMTSLQLPIVEAAASDILGTRRTQQDDCWYGINSAEHELLAVVCDGMGGLSGGEQASETAISVISELYRQSAPIQDPQAFFREAAIAANKAVQALKTKDGKALNAGSTVVAVLIREDEVYWLSIGDSRIYLLRDCEIYPCCKEHNYEAMLREKLDSGEITPEEALADKTRRDALTSYLGIRSLKLMEINQTPLKLLPNDMLLLCSDGLYKSLKDDEICRLAVENKMDVQMAAETLTAQALAHAVGGQDNTTVILIRYNGDLFDDGYFG